MKIVNCIECAAPWGAILDRAGDNETDAQATILAEMTRGWADQWDLDREPGWPATPPPMPAPLFHTEEVVHVSESDARWLSGNDLAEVFVGACWQPVADSDLPAWFVRSRRTRTAVLVDRCCDHTTHPLREHARAVTTALARMLTAA
jgi:hypothetical protein